MWWFIPLAWAPYIIILIWLADIQRTQKWILKKMTNVESYGRYFNEEDWKEFVGE